MKNRRHWAHLAVPILITALVVLILILQESFALALIALMIGTFWGTYTIYRVKDRPLAYEIRALSKQTLKESQANLGSSEATHELLNRIQKRQIAHSTVTNNIAGTVVRTSNRLKELPVLATPSPVSGQISEALPPVQKKDLDSGKKVAKDSTDKFTFPTPTPTRKKSTYSDIRVVMIADEFTAEAFAYEWNVVQPTKDNWRDVIEEHNPHFLFVESAWEAVGGSWRYQFVGGLAPRKEIQELISYCKEKNIPTAFWNKEDPPHFEDFLKTAGLFDFVFTTEGRKIGEYKQRLNHNNIALLPFAAQPVIHNPARLKLMDRDRNIMFAGMYFRDKYPERRLQMDMLLPPSAKLGLDIFSRQDGTDPKYRFPDSVADKVRGSLPYHQVLGAYHAYKAVINVNSVVSSETMCARRIFEATACGAAVITNHTNAIDTFFPNNLLNVVSNEADAYSQMRALLRSEEYRDRKVLQAQRHLWENHTYSHRAEVVMEKLGIPFESQTQNSELISYFVSTNRPQNIENVFLNVSRQALPNKELVLLTHGFELSAEKLEALKSEYSLPQVKVLHAEESQTLGANLNQLTAASDGEYLFRMDDDDFYGTNYSRDLLNMLKVTNATLAGKAASYIYFEALESSVLTFAGKEHRFTDFVRGATFCGPKSTFVNFQFPEMERSEDSNFLTQVKKSGGTIYASDRFNFMVSRYADKSTHTWTVDDFQLFSTGDMKFVGSDSKQIEV